MNDDKTSDDHERGAAGASRQHTGAGDGADFRLRSVALSAYGPTVLEAMGYGASIPIVPLLARQLGASVQLAAFIVALLGLGQLVCSVPAGTLIARVGERAAMVTASAIGVVVALAAAAAPNLMALGVAIFVMGMTWSVFLLSRQGFMIDAVPPHLRARALSTLGGSHRIGLFLGPILAAPLILAYGVRSTLVLSAILSGLALLLILGVPDLGGDARAEGRADPASVWTVLRAHRHTLATLGLGVTAINGLRALRISVVPLWADHISLAPAQVSLLFAISSLVEIAIFYPAGWVMDRRGRVWVAVPTALLLGAGLALLPLARTFDALLAVTALMAIGNGLGSGIVMTLGADTAPRVHRAKYLGGWRLVGDLGGSGGPLALSGLVALAGLSAAVVSLGTVGMLAAGWVGWWVASLDRSRRGNERMPT